MKYRYFWLLIMALIPFLSAAQADIEVSHVVHFPDKAQAQLIISTDEIDGYFEKITLADLSIQLKEDDYNSDEYVGALLDYYRLLQSEVIEFTDAEKQKLRDIFARIERELHFLNPTLQPDSINLIKIQGIAFGSGAFFTRENTIYIPGGMLYAMNDEQLYNVMLHEVFHIISRYDESLRQKMYEIVHYERVNDSICLPEETEKRMLLNPDGIDYRYSIDLSLKTGETVRVIPMLMATDTLYNSNKGQYFNHMRFGLFPLVRKNDACLTVVVDKHGYSLLDQDVMQIYQEKVGDVTRYNIHPDELMADHFAFAVMANESGDFSRFSQAGQAALKAVLEILREN